MTKKQQTPQNNECSRVNSVGHERHGRAHESVVREILLLASVLYIDVQKVSRVVRVESLSVLVDTFVDIVREFPDASCQGSHGGREKDLDGPVRKPRRQLVDKVAVAERGQKLLSAFDQLKSQTHQI